MDARTTSLAKELAGLCLPRVRRAAARARVATDSYVAVGA